MEEGNFGSLKHYIELNVSIKKKKKKKLDSKKIYLQNWTSIDLNSGVKAREIVECLSIKLKYHMNYQLIASSLYNYIFFVIIVKNLLDQNLLELD